MTRIPDDFIKEAIQKGMAELDESEMQKAESAVEIEGAIRGGEGDIEKPKKRGPKPKVQKECTCKREIPEVVRNQLRDDIHAISELIDYLEARKTVLMDYLEGR